jgi:hypothetical protein
MLLPDEQNIINWLTEYGTLKRRQLEMLLHNKPVNTAIRIIRKMIDRALIFSPHGTGFIGLDNITMPDEKILDAIWVLLKFEVEACNHYRTQYPAQVFFIKGVFSYEICVLRAGEEHLTKLLRPKPDHKFIIVIENEAQISKMVLPDNACLFAIIQASDEFPIIQFLQQGG